MAQVGMTALSAAALVWSVFIWGMCTVTCCSGRSIWDQASLGDKLSLAPLIVGPALAAVAAMALAIHAILFEKENPRPCGRGLSRT